jgi:hypothetical protein
VDAVPHRSFSKIKEFEKFEKRRGKIEKEG